jgi:hypothetical protein
VSVERVGRRVGQLPAETLIALDRAPQLHLALG